jgi:hypothetical protein
VEDLEEDAKPEDLMLSYVSGDKSKVRCSSSSTKAAAAPAAPAEHEEQQWAKSSSGSSREWQCPQPHWR